MTYNVIEGPPTVIEIVTHFDYHIPVERLLKGLITSLEGPSMEYI